MSGTLLSFISLSIYLSLYIYTYLSIYLCTLNLFNNILKTIYGYNYFHLKDLRNKVK
jgi:hypothetical protein